MSADIAIRITGDDVDGALRKLLGQVEDTRPAMREISQTLADSVEEAFETESDPETGTPWPELAESTILQRTKRGTWPGKMLQISQGGLAASYIPTFSDRLAAAFSNKPYARIQHLGGQAGRNRKVTIPARKHAGLTPEHRDEVLDIIERHLRG